MNNKKIFIVVISVALLSVAAYFFVGKNSISDEKYKNDIINQNINLKEEVSDIGEGWKIYEDRGYGFDMKYPSDWKYDREYEDNLFSVSFYPIEESVVDHILVMRTNPELGLKLKDLDKYISGLKDSNQKIGGKSYGDKDYVYTSSDSESMVGREFKEEFTSKGHKAKRLIVVVPGNNSMYTFMYTSLVDDYDKNYATALEMLNSWKIDN